MRRLGALVGAVLMGAGMVAASPPAHTSEVNCSRVGTRTEWIEGRRYILHIPAGAPGRLPAVVDFHGRDQDADSQRKLSGFAHLADYEDFIVVWPEALDGAWNMRGADGDYVDEILDHLPCENPRRVYASGMSMGSAMTFAQACREDRRFAAFGGVAFSIFPNCALAEPAPIIFFHGTADQVVPFVGGRTRSGATAPPAEVAMRHWARFNGCDPRAVSSRISSRITKRHWQNCRDQADVVFFRVEGLKHTWPKAANSRLSAATAMWTFFKTRSLP